MLMYIMPAMREMSDGGGDYLEYLGAGALSVTISTGVSMIVHSSYMGKSTLFLKTLPLRTCKL